MVWNNIRYFNRDISWLSFNYRVLLEAEDSDMPVYERINFLAIHASNLEEFYKIRVAEHRSVIMKKIHSEENPAEAEETLELIKQEVTRQQQEFSRILSDEILPELARQHIILYMNSRPLPQHRAYISNFFMEEIFPFLQPVMLMKDDVRIFIRDNRLYQVVQLRKKSDNQLYYAIIKIPYAKAPRFIPLPPVEGNFYYMFIEDVIAANLSDIFIGYTVIGSYNIKISRDADIYIDSEKTDANIVETIKKKVQKRKIGDLSRFVYDRQMPENCLDYICDTFHIHSEDLIPDNAHLNLEDLAKLPNPIGQVLENQPPAPIYIDELNKSKKMLPMIRKKDLFFCYPYHSFDHFINFLREAAASSSVEEIMVTQYRVAEDSEIINNLIYAARNKKKVTVFVELKARFDEEHNLYTAKMMAQAGINILYSLPGLKVHAKVALVTEKSRKRAYAYLSTGNFNEKTARLYSDMAILTANKKLTGEIIRLFDVLKGEPKSVTFKYLWVTQFNLLPMLKDSIRREIANAQTGKEAYIILKMNGLQDHEMIEELYRASEAGVKIDLIVRGICCIVPNRTYSRNIRITRIVDMFLEHSRIWYFRNGGKEDLYLTSADWMKRNLYRRIETAFPVLDKKIKQTIIEILKIQLNDNVKACRIDENLNNIFPARIESATKIHAQRDIYAMLAGNSMK